MNRQEHLHTENVCNGPALLLSARDSDAFLFPGYAHIADKHLVEATEKIGILIAQAMAGTR